MHKTKIIFYTICACLSASTVFSSFGMIKNFEFKPDRLPGDTSSFIPDVNGGWNILFSYLNKDTPDSVQFELILRQGTGRIRGSNEQFIGTITNNLFLPKKDQKIGYALLPENTWYLLVKKNGQCYLAQVTGSGIKKSDLPGNPDVIPIKVRYKNN